MDRIKKHSSKHFRSAYDSIQAEDKELITEQGVHWHNFFEIEYIVDGDGEYSINGFKSKIEPGKIFFSTPTDFQKIKFTRRTRIINISFIGELVDEKLLPDLTTPLITDDKDNYYITILKNILNHIHLKSKHNLIYITGMLNAFLVSLLQNSHALKENTPASSNPYFHKTILYISNNFTETLTIDELAKNVNISPDHLSRVFKKTTGVTIGQYITEMRLSYAKSLVKMSNLPINEICIKSGFASHEHFSRIFKEKFGLSPAKYRNSLNKT